MPRTFFHIFRYVFILKIFRFDLSFDKRLNSQHPCIACTKCTIKATYPSRVIIYFFTIQDMHSWNTACHLTDHFTNYVISHQLLLPDEILIPWNDSYIFFYISVVFVVFFSFTYRLHIFSDFIFMLYENVNLVVSPSLDNTISVTEATLINDT